MFKYIIESLKDRAGQHNAMESDQLIETKPCKLYWIVSAPKKCQAWLIAES